MPKSRSSLSWHLFVGAIVLILFLVISQVVMVWRSRSRLEAKLADLRATGHPASLADLKPSPIGDDQNAAVQLARIQGDLAAYDVTFLKTFEETDLGKAWTNGQARGDLPTAEQLAAIKAILNRYPAVLPALRRAVKCSSYASQADFNKGTTKYFDSTLEAIRHFRSLSRFVTVQMEVLTAEGQRDDAVRLGIALLRVTRLYDAEPLTVNYLVALAIRGMVLHSLNDTLQRGAISPDVGRELEAELALHDPIKQLGHVFQTERAYGLSAIDDQLSGPGDFLHWPKMNWKSDLIDCYAEIIALADFQWFEATGKLGAIRQKAISAGSGPFRQQVVGSVDINYNAANRTMAQLRCLRVINALREFSTHNGRDATGLDELLLPKTATVDPFTGQPLKLKTNGKGWIVYSVMDNNADDGGDFNHLKDCGFGPPGHGYVPDEPQEDVEAAHASETP